MADTVEFNRGPLMRDFLTKVMPYYWQGTLDGACGVYCVCMILDYFEVCDPRREALRKSTILGRRLAKLGEPLVKSGLRPGELQDILEAYPNTPLKTKRRRIVGSSFSGARKVAKDLVEREVPG